MGSDFDAMEKFPVWKEKYAKLGVRPLELYMCQNGLCWLTPEVNPEGKVTFYCTDGEERGITAQMVNPSLECVQCMVRFMTCTVEHQIENNKSEEG